MFCQFWPGRQRHASGVGQCRQCMNWSTMTFDSRIDSWVGFEILLTLLAGLGHNRPCTVTKPPWMMHNWSQSVLHGLQRLHLMHQRQWLQHMHWRLQRLQLVDWRLQRLQLVERGLQLMDGGLHQMDRGLQQLMDRGRGLHQHLGWRKDARWPAASWKRSMSPDTARVCSCVLCTTTAARHCFCKRRRQLRPWQQRAARRWGWKSTWWRWRSKIHRPFFPSWRTSIRSFLAAAAETLGVGAGWCWSVLVAFAYIDADTWPLLLIVKMNVDSLYCYYYCHYCPLLLPWPRPMGQWLIIDDWLVNAAQEPSPWKAWCAADSVWLLDLDENGVKWQPFRVTQCISTKKLSCPAWAWGNGACNCKPVSQCKPLEIHQIGGAPLSLYCVAVASNHIITSNHIKSHHITSHHVILMPVLKISDVYYI